MTWLLPFLPLPAPFTSPPSCTSGVNMNLSARCCNKRKEEETAPPRWQKNREHTMQQQPTSQSIHPDTRIGTATLRVAQLDRSLHFYEDVLGFRRLEQTSESVVIGAEDMTPLLILTEEPGAQPQPRQFAGVYHIAILLPGRAELGQLLARMIEAGIEIGQGDHLVSEALYISDPDAIGLELYRDRPRDTWNWSEERRVQMASNRVDLEGMLAEGEQSTH